MAEPLQMAGSKIKVNRIGLQKTDYRGNLTTLCQGCGHNSISNQIIAACYEANILPEDVVKFSGIGCSSKSPSYFLSRSFGFNSLHGRMPSVATGALFGNKYLHGIGVSGDGDTTNIGMGQFKHVIRRNVPLVYIIENNGVYGLTKGQFSATAEVGLNLKYQGVNSYMPIDIPKEALIAGASFIARSFAGDPKQVKELLKAALSHRGIAILDIISPCVTFNNSDEAYHSYAWGREHEVAIHDLSYVPPSEEITVDYAEGEFKEVTLHDGSKILLKKLEREYDPTSRVDAMRVLEESDNSESLLTGLIYIDPDRPDLIEQHNLVDEPLNRLNESDLRPAADTIDMINNLMF
ncbi:MAG: 2-oxoacid:ferredoxin oxidoreductase subunit beta [Anaerolineae bacterium]|nr:2-oxoacid:ferredoxin oxidoreductase subunit beta [Anaerolineae bacterium]MDK1081649.1 2-oxoacid:ferredoxin oxidoreductase subunit beta [Anaerolineae bacterium]MDK1118258.1 2-oxoacid:ferredoxin oxidoreductase subunit beta [Anaerolineae bacterium]